MYGPDCIAKLMLTNVSKVVQSIRGRPIENLLPIDKQGETVKQSVDGISGLVYGHDDGSAMISHSGGNRVWLGNFWNKSL